VRPEPEERVVSAGRQQFRKRLGFFGGEKASGDFHDVYLPTNGFDVHTDLAIDRDRKEGHVL
jgi:hypothetical protein